MKRIVLVSNALPGGVKPYAGEYIYKVRAFREGSGLGEGFPKPEFLEYELEGVGGINGRLEKTRALTSDTPLDCRKHKYYLIENDVWVRNMGGLRYMSDWSATEQWAIAEERTYDDGGNVTAARELGFAIIHSDRKAGYAV